MVQRIISIAEALCLIGSLVMAMLWARDPGGNYEPYVVLFGIIIVLLDVARRILRASKLNVFLSVGATYTKEQEEYVKAFERFLSDNNCKRLVVGRDCPAARQPVLQVRDLMKKADAVIVLAFTRYIIKSGAEKPNADIDKQKEKSIKNIKYPTVWNQIEASMAFGLNRPLFVILEKGLKQEAMLKDRLEFKAIITEIDKDYFETLEFKTIFEDFSSIERRRSWLKL